MLYKAQALASLPSLSNLSHSCLGLSSLVDLLETSNFNEGPHPNSTEFLIFHLTFLEKNSFKPSNGDSYSHQNMVDY